VIRADTVSGMPADLTVLFCTDPLTPGRVDAHFAAQAATVRDLGGTVALIDHDALLAGDAPLSVRKVPRDAGPVWYRGWMIPSASYDDLSQALTDRGAPLHVTPDRYRTAHELPGWYATFEAVTPQSVWTPWKPGEEPSQAQIAEWLAPLGSGPAIVKDYVKSRKHEWAEACFIPDATDIEHATTVIARMIELQEDTLQGGVVLRRFENYEQADGRTVEARVWWVDGEPALVSAHPDTPERAPEPDLTAIVLLVRKLGCRFITTDVARRDDGVWRVVEVGDGQVSDLPAGADARVLFSALGR